MLVETPAINMSVVVRSVETGEEQMTLAGMASTIPCRVIVSRQAADQLIRLFANCSVIRFALSALFVRAENRGPKMFEPYFLFANRLGISQPF